MKVIEKVYFFVIGRFFKEEIFFGFNIIGYMFEIFFREVIELVREGIVGGLIEIIGMSYIYVIFFFFFV